MAQFSFKNGESLLDNDTTPGANGVFAPPCDFSGGNDKYVQFMRYRYGLDMLAKQQMVVVGRLTLNPGNCIHAPVFHGPFADTAKKLSIACFKG